MFSKKKFAQSQFADFALQAGVHFISNECKILLFRTLFRNARFTIHLFLLPPCIISPLPLYSSILC